MLKDDVDRAFCDHLEAVDEDLDGAPTRPTRIDATPADAVVECGSLTTITCGRSSGAAKARRVYLTHWLIAHR